MKEINTNKVLSLYGIGDIRLETRPVPCIKEDEVLLEVKACGICSSDEDRIFKNGTYHFPTVPGHEFAGKIVKTGSNVDESLIGLKASVFPLLPCFRCESCEKGEYATCSNYRYFGSRNDGAFSEYLAVPEWNLRIIDDSVSYEVAALSEPAAVACHAMKIGKVQKGDKVLVIGTGAIGTLIAGMCNNIGAESLVAGRREESVNLVKECGIETALITELDNNSVEADVVFEAVGSNESLSLAIEQAKANGTIVVVGNPKEDLILEKNVYWKILRKQLSVCGTWNSSYKGDDDDWEIVAEMMKKKEFPFERIITAKYSLDQYKEALNHLQDKKKSKSRIVFIMNEED